MVAKEILLTDEGLKKLEDELESLKTEKRKEIAEKIKEARSFGDLSENSEYDEAKNEQAMVEARIAELEAILKHVRIVDEEELNTDVINIGSKVKVLDVSYNEEAIYQLVGSTETDPANGKISDESPVGKALIGHRVGEEVEVEVPDDVLKFIILEIFK